MATIADLLVRIGGDSKELQKEIAAVKRQMKSSFGGDALEFSQGAATTMMGIAAGMGVLGIASIKMASDFQASERAFTTLLKDGDQAKNFLNDLAQFAANTPFELQGLTDTAKKLLAFKFQAQDIIPIMQTVGDAAAMLGSGQDGINGMTMALSQMQAKGKVQGEELLQLAERGVNAYQYLADAMGVSVAEAQDKVSKGMVSSKEGINAILFGMQKDFAGGMKGISEEMTGILSNIKDGTASVMREIGLDLIEELNLKEHLKSVADWTGEFAQKIKEGGINQALKDMIPPEVGAAIFAMAGALVFVAYPAMKLAAFGAVSMLAPFALVIAKGAALGALAYLIWRAWEPLGDYFSAAWTKAGAVTEGVTSTILLIIYEFVHSSLTVLSSLSNFLGGAFSDSINNGLANVSSAINTTVKGIENAKTRSAAASVKMGENWGAVGDTVAKGISGIVDSGKQLNTEFKGLSSTSAASAAGVSETGKSASKAAKEMDKLAQAAKRLSESIEQEWVRLIKNQIEQLDIWHAEQLKELEASKVANENYERDKERVAQIYSIRRIKILQDEANSAREQFRQMRDDYVNILKDVSFGSLGGSAKLQFDLDLDFTGKTQKMTDYFTKINQDFETADAAGKQRILANLDKFGVEYQNIDGKRLDFSKTMADMEAAYLAQKKLEEIANYQQCKDIQADIDEAYRFNSLTMLQEALTAENAIRLNDMEAQKEMMAVYQEAFLASQMTASQLIASMYSTAFSGLSGALSDIFTGTKSVSDAFQALGKSMLKVIADFVAKKIAGDLMIALFGKAIMATQVAASVAAGKATAAAWADAAAYVSLASWGANSVPAMAGIEATLALTAAGSGGLSGGGSGGGPPATSDFKNIVPFANGGIVTSATLGMIGEGKYDEAVFPLNKRLLSKYFDFSSTDGSNTITGNLNIYGDINNGSDEDSLFDSLNDMIFAGI